MLIEIWSDVVCPWCAIGRARLDRALDTLSDDARDEVDIRWRSFELDPNRAATTDVDYVSMLAAKYRTSTDQAQAMIDRMTQAGADDGIEFCFDVARPGNTFDAHRVLHLAVDRGRQDEVKQRFLAGYHSEGEPIADHATLTRLAGEAGLDTDEVAAVLASDRYADEVRADEELAFEFGVSGVPFFVFDRAVAVSGAQPPEVLLEAMQAARDRTAERAGRSTATATATATTTGADAIGDHRGHDGHDHDTDTHDGHAHDHDTDTHDGHAHTRGEACVDGVCAV